ncbi:MAG: copper transporter [Firmicutes bacterium]|nr:copper transporter [Bacillota bacterium]
MNFGFRYHVASLIAVFFSLILGILIGGALFPDHILVDEQANIITELEDRFRQTQANLALVEKELHAAEGAWGEMLTSISQDLLEAKSVVLVDTGIETETVDLRTILQLAGAEVVEIEPAGLTELKATQESVFVFPLTDEPIPADVEVILESLASAGHHLVFVWDQTTESVAANLPQALLVDSIDTSTGQLAFLLGIARGREGHYGRQKGALGLFP